MTVAYATAADLTAFNAALSALDAAEALRKLERASELLDDLVRRPFGVDTLTGLPDDLDVAAALQQATCAQVEYWELGPGEEHDIEGMANRGVSIGHLRVDALPPELAPRAFRLLHAAGLLSSSDIDTTAFRFFATTSGS